MRREPILKASAVDFCWGNNVILRDFSLDVHYGEVVCLMGVNGCGKSTFIDCALGELKPVRGTITIEGTDTQDLSAVKRARMLSYVPQLHDRTFPYTVEHIVLMGRTAHLNGAETPDDDDRQLAKEALGSCGITHLSQRSCLSLSGGEMQMVLLARALAQNTPLMLLDEPTSHLDFKNELLFLETITELIKVKDIAVLMATHAPNQVFLLSASGLKVKVALMTEGRVVRFGQPEEVLNPQNLEEFFEVRACMMYPDTASHTFSGAEDLSLIQGLQQIISMRVVNNNRERTDR